MKTTSPLNLDSSITSLSNQGTTSLGVKVANIPITSVNSDAKWKIAQRTLNLAIDELKALRLAHDELNKELNVYKEVNASLKKDQVHVREFRNIREVCRGQDEQFMSWPGSVQKFVINVINERNETREKLKNLQSVINSLYV